MKHLRIQMVLGDMVRAILHDKPGFVELGTVWMQWDGKEVSWDTPVSQWDVEKVWVSLMERAERHPEVERIAICAQDLSSL